MVHGQVVVGWANALEINHILLVNDGIKADEAKKSLLSMAVPPEIKLTVLDIREAAEYLKTGQDNNDRLIVLVASLADCLSVVEAGAPVKKVNVGGLRFGTGKKQVMPAVYLSRHDIEAVEKLNAMGITVEGRSVPTDKPVDILQSVRKADNVR